MREGSKRIIKPKSFVEAMYRYQPQFRGHEQHDAQEFLGYILDGLHEDLNLVIRPPVPRNKTPQEEASFEALPEVLAADMEWESYRSRSFAALFATEVVMFSCFAPPQERLDNHRLFPRPVHVQARVHGVPPDLNNFQRLSNLLLAHPDPGPTPAQYLAA